MFKNGSNSWLFWGFELSLTHFPRGPQFVLTEVKVSWILWSWQRVFWSWVMRRLSVHYPCHPLSTSHEQKSVSLGSQFFWSTESISYWGSCGWSCHPLSRRKCLSHRRQPWQPLGESPVGIDLRYPTMVCYRNLYVFCDKIKTYQNISKHSASFPSFLSCIEFRFRRTA